MSVVTHVDPKTIIEELRNAELFFVPREALAKAIAQQDAIVPLLIQELEAIMDDFDPERFADDPLPGYALAILGHCKATQAAEVVYRFVSMVGEEDSLN